MAEHDFSTLMAALDSPLIVVTTADERERAGCLVEFHGQSSIEPQRYCAWLSKANYTYRVALHASHLVIAGPFRPLRGSAAAHLRAGHGARERPEPPTERAAPV
jgi:flavin reductase (DIM6/NTAB) family NADH-FMN oxidoreductase RutF